MYAENTAFDSHMHNACNGLVIAEVIIRDQLGQSASTLKEDIMVLPLCITVNHVKLDITVMFEVQIRYPG